MHSQILILFFYTLIELGVEMLVVRIFSEKNRGWWYSAMHSFSNPCQQIVLNVTAVCGGPSSHCERRIQECSTGYLSGGGGVGVGSEDSISVVRAQAFSLCDKQLRLTVSLPEVTVHFRDHFTYEG